jgi:ferredoxin
MTRSCRIEVDGECFTAQAGELLLDAALVNGVDMPFDCRSGYCGSCLVHLNDGLVIGGANAGTGLIHACQARIVSALTVSTDKALAKPAAIGEVAEINQLLTGTPPTDRDNITTCSSLAFRPALTAPPLPWAALILSTPGWCAFT